MTIIETIHATDSLLPNSYDSLTKAGWVLEADGMVRAEIHGEKADLTAQGKDACETDRTLAVPYPFDMIYRHYLLAMICHANGDYTQYNNHIINYFCSGYVCLNFCKCFFGCNK